TLAHRVSITSLLLMVFVFLISPAHAALEWPKEIEADQATVVIYQPQPEKLSGNMLSGRAAISITLKDTEEPIFGVMWFTARLDTDRDSDTVIVSDIKVENVAWPESKDAGEQRFTAIFEASIPEEGVEISMERLSASLQTAELEQKSLTELKNDPPIIEFLETLTVLLMYDGEPRLKDIENSDYQRVMNTPFAVACDKKGKACWLSSGSFWYKSKEALGPFTPNNSPPADLAKMIPAPEEQDGSPLTPPLIVVATEATEVISTQGKPKWTALTGGELLYVENTETAWLRELSTGNMYVLLSGRWFRAKQQSGPWTFVRPDELPASFSEIPPASDIGGVRNSVAGTPEAEDAILNAAIPQTAAIKRSEASLTVEYDGNPKFEQIEGTDVAYAVNSAAQVLQIDQRYYAVDNGVWFSSAVATGPWVVADSVPADKIAEIPPSSPVYNTTHVVIYESTPEVVYVGYTPGYMWSFPYYGVPVYGTGWYYPPYYGAYYYPRPPTWGFHVGYNPWTGWNYGVSWSNGFFSVGIAFGGGYGGHCCGGWYGGGSHGDININTGNINIGNSINIGNHENIGNQIGNNPKARDRIANQNIYNRPENLTRNADRTRTPGGVNQSRPSTRENNVYADKSGQVARNNGGNWETRDNGSWKSSASSSNRTSDLTSVSRPTNSSFNNSSFNQRDLNSHQSARQFGASREMGRSMPRGGRGGRRR
ncbi:MAG: hypothetical protein ACI9R7_001929, partial [Lysobacterales bacterium]